MSGVSPRPSLEHLYKLPHLLNMKYTILYVFLFVAHHFQAGTDIWLYDIVCGGIFTGSLIMLCKSKPKESPQIVSIVLVLFLHHSDFILSTPILSGLLVALSSSCCVVLLKHTVFPKRSACCPSPCLLVWCYSHMCLPFFEYPLSCSDFIILLQKHIPQGEREVKIGAIDSQALIGRKQLQLERECVYTNKWIYKKKYQRLTYEECRTKALIRTLISMYNLPQNQPHPPMSPNTFVLILHQSKERSCMTSQQHTSDPMVSFFCTEFEHFLKIDCKQNQKTRKIIPLRGTIFVEAQHADIIETKRKTGTGERKQDELTMSCGFNVECQRLQRGKLMTESEGKRMQFFRSRKIGRSKRTWSREEPGELKFHKSERLFKLGFEFGYEVMFPRGFHISVQMLSQASRARNRNTLNSNKIHRHSDTGLALINFHVIHNLVMLDLWFHVECAWKSQARAIFAKKRHENKAGNMEEHQAAAAALILYLLDTFSFDAFLPFPAPSPRAGGSASYRMLSFWARDFLQARRWGTLQLRMTTGNSHIQFARILSFSLCISRPFFYMTRTPTMMSVLGNDAPNDASVHQKCESQTGSLGEGGANSDTRKKDKIFVFLIFFLSSESKRTCAGKCEWQSGQKRASCAACGFYGRPRLIERGEVSSWRRRVSDEKLIICREVWEASAGEAVSLRNEIYPPSQQRSRPSEPQETSIKPRLMTTGNLLLPPGREHKFLVDRSSGIAKKRNGAIDTPFHLRHGYGYDNHKWLHHDELAGDYFCTSSIANVYITSISPSTAGPKSNKSFNTVTHSL
ncbi:hypothetical protein VP01_1499g1 [Puccinia sorghi]|uniref:Uncharacterized protein n=1 Tax=Puccinia sorghi TaxID=27349 RepID=A0A0L6VJ69_9BASI|nr:hypothetical protein VP01_1499g1 [Puccinia sorghi]